MRKKFEDHSAIIGVVGLGYAGLPGALAFAEAGFRVRGVDLDDERVRILGDGGSYLSDIPAEAIGRYRTDGRLEVSTAYDILSDADAILICVPTPLKDQQPDLEAIETAGRATAEILPPGCLVVLESTSYPGTTEEVLLPLLAAGERVVGEDFHLAFSPERIDPGNETYSFRDIPKIVGGVTPKCTELAVVLYAAVVDRVITVSGPREAELAKLLENTFRNINIALVNELAVYAHDMKINIWEAIDAAASKPFGFMPFYPGPGVGGHCIGIDPSYLSWKVKQSQGHAFRFVELADEMNEAMPRFVVGRIAELLNDRGKALRGARLLIIGVAYKPGIEDPRESPSLKVVQLLLDKGSDVDYHDPLVPSVIIAGNSFSSVSLDAARLNGYDVVVIITPQPNVDYAMIMREAPLVFDTRNSLGPAAGPNVVTL